MPDPVTARIQKPVPPTASEMGAPFRVIRSLGELELLKRRWNRLLSEEASPFQTFAWNAAWFRYYEAEYDEIFVILTSGGRAIFPFYRRGRTLRLAGDQMCDYQDVIASDPVAAEAALEEVGDWCRKQDLNLKFSRLSTQGLLYPILREMEAGQGWFRPVEKMLGPCPTLALKSTAEETLSHLPRKFRSKLGRQERRVKKDFEGLILDISEPPEHDASRLEGMVEFHRDQFAQKGSNPLDDERLVLLLNEIRNDPDVGLRLTRLGTDEVTLAEDFTFIRGTRFYGFLTSFDRDYARYGPGIVMMTRRLERLCKAGINTFDFLCGPEAYKYRFATDEYFVRTVHLFPTSARGFFGWLWLRGDYLLRESAKWVLIRLGLRERPSYRIQFEDAVCEER